MREETLPQNIKGHTRMLADQENNSARSGGITADEWCLSFGFAQRTVNKWFSKNGWTD
jgi:hypothetical protein